MKVCPGVTKEIVEQGSGEFPTPGALVNFRFVERLDGKVHDTSIARVRRKEATARELGPGLGRSSKIPPDRSPPAIAKESDAESAMAGEPWSGTLDKAPFRDRGLFAALESMRKGERAIVKVVRHLAGVTPTQCKAEFVEYLVELVDFTDMIQYAGFLLVRRKILKRGEGRLQPNRYATVSVRVEALFPDESGAVSRATKTLNLAPICDSEDVSTLLIRIVLQEMRLHEETEVVVSVDAADSESLDDPRVIQYARENGLNELSYKFTLLSLQPGLEHYQLRSVEERITRVNERRELGNVHFKDKRYQLAIDKYEQAIETFRNPRHARTEEARLAVAKAYANLALVYSRLNDWENSCENAEQATVYAPSYSKGWRWRACALLNQGKAAAAFKAAKKAAELDETPNARKLLKDCSVVMEKQRELADAPLRRRMRNAFKKNKRHQ
ncbi:MAG: hypothetical protein MHM6MM_001902 [Cercozoa sp. M6MM]